MAIDVFEEQVVSFADATKRLPRVRKGRKIHLKTLIRWSRVGRLAKDGTRVHLETIKIGGIRCTSLEALQRFFDRLTDEQEPGSPPWITNREARRRNEQAKKELREMGIL